MIALSYFQTCEAMIVSSLSCKHEIKQFTNFTCTCPTFSILVKCSTMNYNFEFTWLPSLALKHENHALLSFLAFKHEIKFLPNHK